MNNSDSIEKKSQRHNHLDDTLNNVSQIGKEISQKGLEITKVGQELTDWADATRKASHHIDDPQILHSIDASWEMTGKLAGAFLVKAMDIDTNLIEGSTAFSSVSSLLNIAPQLNNLQFACGTDCYNDFQYFRNLSRKPEVYKSVLQLMKSLQLDKPYGNSLSAMEQFETAYKEFSINPSSLDQATSWSIPLRGCIDTILAYLLRQRPVQESTKGDDGKVISICSQLARDGLFQDQFLLIAEECIKIKETFHQSKDKAILREKSMDILSTATLWLKGFLEIIDIRKFRS
jgi:hypothetical protein